MPHRQAEKLCSLMGGSGGSGGSVGSGGWMSPQILCVPAVSETVICQCKAKCEGKQEGKTLSIMSSAQGKLNFSSNFRASAINNDT